MTRPPINEMMKSLEADQMAEMKRYLVVALVPFEFAINEEVLGTEKAKFEAAKEFLNNLGLHGAKVESVDPIPGTMQ